MEVLHDGSSRIQFLLEVFIKIIFRGAHAFFILQSGVQFFLPYLLRWCYVILTAPFLFHDSQAVRNEIFLTHHFQFVHEFLCNPSISSLELSWIIFHLKLSLRIVAIYGAHK